MNESTTKSFMNIAHRGASGHYPENTMLAFRKALEKGFNWIECDVRLTADQQVVVIHDRLVDRTTNATGEVSSFTLTEIKELDAGSWFAEEWAGEQIPTLEELLVLMEKHHARLVIEIKDGINFPEIIEKVLTIVDAAGMKEAVSISSFNWEVLEQVRKLDPEISLSALVLFDPRAEEQYVLRDSGKTRVYNSVDDLLQDCLDRQVDIVCPPADETTSEMVDRLHQHDLLVRVWGLKRLNDKEIEDLLRMGIDGATADYPDQLEEKLREMKIRL